jgi:hypothetical protein
MKNVIITAMLLFSVSILTGCSAIAYNKNKTAAIEQRVYRSGDPNAIKAFKSGDVYGLAVDLGATDVIFRSWGSLGTQLGAAAVDGGVIYGLTELIDGSSSSDDGDSLGNNSSGGDTIINTGNNVSIETANGTPAVLPEVVE